MTCGNSIKIVIVFFLYMPFLMCMEENPIVQNNRASEALQAGLIKKPTFLNNDTLCALALVNKQLNKAVEDTTKPRRAYFISQKDYQAIRRQNPCIYKQTGWNKHNSAFAYWRKIDNGDN